MISPLIASLAQASGVLVDKIALSRRKVPLKKFIPLLFVLLTLFTLIALPWDNQIAPEVFSWPVGGYFILMIALAFVWNILYYRSIQVDSVQEFEPILMLSPLLVIVLAPIFFPEERQLLILIIALIAGLILVFSHLKKGHIVFKKSSLGLIFCVILMSLEVLVIKKLLFSFSPIALYLVRCSILFLIFSFYFRADFLRIHPTSLWQVALSSFLGVIQMLARFYGYQGAGIVFTTLVLVIAPVLVYIFGFFILKEKISYRKLVGGIVIFVCVIAGYLLS